MAKHLPIGGSTAERTIKCPAWLERKKRFNPSNKSNFYADEGNLLHDAMENFYQHDMSFEAQIGKTTFKDLVLRNDHLPLLESAQAATDIVLNGWDIVEYVCEPFVQYRKDEIGGSIDMLGVSADGNTALILDYKFGSNKVSAEENSQLMFYAMCAKYDEHIKHMVMDVTEWVLVIVQPKVSRDPSIYPFPWYGVDVFESRFLGALAEPNRSQTGPHCKYCPVSPYCPDKKKQALAALTLSKVSATELGQSWLLAKELKSWIADVEEETKTKLLQGGQIDDLKLVAGRKSQKYNVSDEELIASFGDEIQKIDLLTPAQAKKKLGKDIEPFITKEDGPPTVAHVTDKRDAIVIDVEKSLEKFVVKNSTMF